MVGRIRKMGGKTRYSGTEVFVLIIQVRNIKDETKEERVWRRLRDLWNIFRSSTFESVIIHQTKRKRIGNRKTLSILTWVTGLRIVLATNLGNVRVGLDLRFWEGNNCGFTNLSLKYLCRWPENSWHLLFLKIQRAWLVHPRLHDQLIVEPCSTLPLYLSLAHYY